VSLELWAKGKKHVEEGRDDAVVKYLFVTKGEIAFWREVQLAIAMLLLVGGKGVECPVGDHLHHGVAERRS
jgi:hypothetical protein